MWLALLTAPILHAQTTSLDVVNSVARFYALSSEQAAMNRPVHIEGVVLYCDPEWQLFWVQDETGSIFLQIDKSTKRLTAGTRVAINAKTALVKGIRRLRDLKIRVVGKDKLPPPQVLMPLKVHENRQVNQWVTMTGTVVEMSLHGDHLRLVVAFLRRFQVQVIIDNATRQDAENLLGAQVEVAGCLSEYSGKSDARLIPFQMFVPEPTHLSVFRRGPSDLFASPTIPAEALDVEFRQLRDPRLVRLDGEVVTLEDKALTIKSEGGEARVRLKSAAKFAIGTRVATVGFVWRDRDEGLLLDRAVARIEKRGTAQIKPVMDLPVLKTAHALHALNRKMAAERFPVEIAGNVLYYDPIWRVMFVHDGSRGFYVDDKRRTHELNPGDSVVVRGASDPGGFAPMVVATKIIKKDRAAKPDPQPRIVSFGRLLSGAEDSQWIRLKGKVLAIELSQTNLLLTLRGAEGDFEAVICKGAHHRTGRNWVGSQVTLDGVCGVKSNAKNEPTGIYLHVPTMRHVRFEEEAPHDVFSISATPIGTLLDGGTAGDDSSIRIAGVVTYADASGRVAIQDETAGLLLHFKTRKTPTVGESIDVVGVPFARVLTTGLRVSEWRLSAVERKLPQAEAMEVIEIEALQSHARFVAIEATVLRNHSTAAAPGLTLQSGGIIFSADLAAPTTSADWLELREGSLIRVRGVLDIRSDDWDRLQSFRLLCPVDGDIELVESAPWWTTRHTWALVSVLAALMLAGLVWGTTLRVTVRRQTSRIKNELATRGQLTAKYNTLVENAGELIFSLDRSGVFLTVNPATQRVFDAPDDELLGQPIGSFLSEESAELLGLLCSRLAIEQPHAAMELRTARGVELEAAMRLVRIDSTDDEEVQFIARDVSERRKLETQIRQMQKMDSVGQLAAGVAHDYNNLLTVVRINSELLQSVEGLSSEDASLLQSICEASDRAASLTQQLLAFSRRQMMTPKSIDPAQMLTEIGEMLQRLIGENFDLRVTVEEAMPYVRVDRGMIEQAVMNLALNARDAMSEGGVIEIRATCETVTRQTATEQVEAIPGDYVKIVVADSGSGIDEDVLPNVFEPFFTTKEVGKGVGLGLSTVFGIAKQHDGWVNVNSEPGKGATFTMYLPVFDPAPNQVEEGAATIAIRACGNETLLVAEDDPSVRLTMTKVLTRGGYDVIESTNGPEALETWQSVGERVDLLITDMVMPGGISGRELAAAIRQQRPQLPCIYCTGYSSHMADSSTLAETECLLTKPFEGSRLVQIVRDMLDATHRPPTSGTNDHTPRSAVG